MPVGNYTTSLFESGLARIAQKVGEEGVETALAGALQKIILWMKLLISYTI